MRLSPARPREIFLSHASGDRRVADQLAATLRGHDISVWYSRTHLRGAQQWQNEIGRALKRCDWFVIILSPQSVKSMWVNRELSYAMNQRRFQNRMVPVLHKKCDFEKLHWALAGFQMVDLTGNFGIGCRDLLRVWRLDYKP